MSDIENILKKMKRSQKGICFNELKKVCEHYFGPPRQSDSSHCIYKTPWHGDPRINIENQKGKAKAYQVKQILLAIEKREMNDGI